MCTLSFQLTSRLKLELKDIFIYSIYSEVNGVHPIFSILKSVETCVERYLNLLYHLFRCGRCELYIINFQVKGYLSWYIFAVKSHLFGGEGCAPYLFNVQVKGNSVETYFHLSRIYSKVKDVSPIYSMFKLKETCVERYLHF